MRIERVEPLCTGNGGCWPSVMVFHPSMNFLPLSGSHKKEQEGLYERHTWHNLGWSPLFRSGCCAFGCIKYGGTIRKCARRCLELIKAGGMIYLPAFWTEKVVSKKFVRVDTKTILNRTQSASHVS